jgi:hypothetical protein
MSEEAFSVSLAGLFGCSLGFLSMFSEPRVLILLSLFVTSRLKNRSYGAVTRGLFEVLLA